MGCDVISLGLSIPISQVEGLAGSLSGAHNLVVPLVSFCSTVSALVFKQQASLLSRSKPQVSEVCRHPVTALSQRTQTPVLWPLSKTWETGCSLHSSFSLLGEVSSCSPSVDHADSKPPLPTHHPTLLCPQGPLNIQINPDLW